MSTVAKRKKCVWGPSADSAFLEIWEEKASELRGPRKNAHIYAEMAQSLAELGFIVRAVDMKYKIHNLTMKYNKYKEKLRTGSPTVTWPFYERVHRIIGNDRTNHFEAVMVDSITAMPEPTSLPPSPYQTQRQRSSSVLASCTHSASPSPIASYTNVKKKKSALAELNDTIKTCMAESNKLTAELIAVEKMKVDTIKRLTQGVIGFLQQNFENSKEYEVDDNVSVKNEPLD